MFEVFIFLSLFLLMERWPCIFKMAVMFDKYIINLNCFRKMVKIEQSSEHSSLKEENLLEEKDSIFEECEEQSTIPPQDITKKEEEMLPKNQPKKGAAIKKERKKRSFNPQGRFLKEHRRRFFLFPFHYSTQFPFCKPSWENWKPSGYFIKMAEFLSNISSSIPNKTGEQCKSFDERQKKEIYTQVDLLQAAFLELKQSKIDSYSLAVLSEYVDKMESKSDYMSFVCENFPEYGDINTSAQPTSLASNQSEARNTHLQIPLESITDLIFNEFFDQSVQQ